jgi:hypothetical protein
MEQVKTREFFGIRHAKTGELLRLSHSEGGHSTNYNLSSYDYPVFEAKTAQALSQILFEDTPGYNSTAECPGWGNFEREDLMPVKVVETVAIEALVLPKRVKFRTVELRAIPQRSAVRYAGCELAVSEGYYFWLVEMPEGESLESLATLEGTSVYANDKYTRRTLLKAVEVPEEYIPLLKNRQGALLIATGLVY